MSAPAAILLDIAAAMDGLPALSDSDRAEIFHAIDTAPAQPTSGTYDPEAEYARAWDRAKGIEVSIPGSTYPVTLWEASGFSSVPTRGEILTSLARARELTK